MTVAIHYTSIKLPTGLEREVFGLQVAIADGLKAYLKYGSSETHLFLIGVASEWEEVQLLAQDAGIDPKRVVALDRRFPEQNFAGLTTIFRPEPDTRDLLWQRQQGGHFSFCGLAHAISGVEAGKVLQEYILAPSDAADAIICPSRAVQAAVKFYWESYAEYLSKRFNASYKCPVQLPVIPLGIDYQKFSSKITDSHRTDQRQRLGIGDRDIVLLWVGRLSAAIKAHPLAMYQAAEKASQNTGVKVHLVMVGYFVPAEAETQFEALAHDICTLVKVHFVASNDRRFPDGLWAAADIFLSLVDNVQESFGLTPIEAMAAGLPRVVSDWDGYRDSVTDGEDGFLIKTMMPPPGNGFELTRQVLNGREVYGGFLAKSALTVAVDVEQAALRLTQLIQDSDLRMIMAEKAKLRCHTHYDWRHIIPAYEKLWDDLAARRALVSEPVATWSSALPQLPDPYSMYGSYPTQSMADGDTVTLGASFEEIKMLWRHEINTYANDVMIAPHDIPVLIGWLGQAQKATVGDVFGHFSAFERPRLWRTLAWLQKLGIIKNSPCEARL